MAKTRLVLLILLGLGPCASARNYALVIGGDSRAPVSQGTVSHDFGVSLYQTAAGLIRSGYETQLLFTPEQGKVRFTETGVLNELTQKDTAPKLLPATREQAMASINALVESAANGDKVVLSVAAHGSNYHERDGTEGWTFSLHSPANGGQGSDQIRDTDIADAVRRLQAKGARVAVLAESCHSGSFRPELLRSLRSPGRNQPPACVITTSLNNQATEACMATDYDNKGKLLSPHNKSASSAMGFLRTWMFWRAQGDGRNPMGKAGNPCWSAEWENFQSCSGKAAENGLRVTADSSLKDVLRAGRLCDQTTSFIDSTGEGMNHPLFDALVPVALQFTYGGPEPGRQPHPVSPEHGTRDLDRLTQAIGRPLSSAASPYQKEMRAKSETQLKAYGDNLDRQREHLARYAHLLKNADDRPALKALLRDATGQVNDALAAEHRLAFAGEPRPGAPPDPPSPTVDTANRIQLLYVLRRLSATPGITVDMERRLTAAVTQLQGGETGIRSLTELGALQADQHGRYQALLGLEREIYESTLGQTQDSCSHFTL